MAIRVPEAELCTPSQWRKKGGGAKEAHGGEIIAPQAVSDTVSALHSTPWGAARKGGEKLTRLEGQRAKGEISGARWGARERESVETGKRRICLEKFFTLVLNIKANVHELCSMESLGITDWWRCESRQRTTGEYWAAAKHSHSFPHSFSPSCRTFDHWLTPAGENFGLNASFARSGDNGLANLKDQNDVAGQNFEPWELAFAATENPHQDYSYISRFHKSVTIDRVTSGRGGSTSAAAPTRIDAASTRSDAAPARIGADVTRRKRGIHLFSRIISGNAASGPSASSDLWQGDWQNVHTMSPVTTGLRALIEAFASEYLSRRFLAAAKHVPTTGLDVDAFPEAVDDASAMP
ncbi:hypothetical protein DFH09DRAFT_1069355 [Mycena vulgaris]|nr:hypothetical protein DFH09DRAFT_1069355 [Mycena vulgaris]